MRYIDTPQSDTITVTNYPRRRLAIGLVIAGIVVGAVALVLAVVLTARSDDTAGALAPSPVVSETSTSTSPVTTVRAPTPNKVTTTACRSFVDDPAVNLVRDSIAAGAGTADSADVADAFIAVFNLEVTAVTPGLDPGVAAAMDIASQQSEAQHTVWVDTTALDPVLFNRMLAGVDTACEAAGVDMA